MSGPELEKKERQDPDAYLYREGMPTPAPQIMSEREERRILGSIASDCAQLLATIDNYTDITDGHCLMDPCRPYLDNIEESLKALGYEVQP